MHTHLSEENLTAWTVPADYNPVDTAVNRLQSTQLHENLLSSLILHSNTTSLEDLALTDEVRTVYLHMYTEELRKYTSMRETILNISPASTHSAASLPSSHSNVNTVKPPLFNPVKVKLSYWRSLVENHILFVAESATEKTKAHIVRMYLDPVVQEKMSNPMKYTDAFWENSESIYA